MSVDVEDWTADFPDRADLPRRAEAPFGRLLDLLEACGARATLFCLVEVAEACAGQVRRAVAAGHRIGLHGLDHRLVYRQTPEELARAVREGRRRLEDLAGVRVTTYRAPCWSITRESLWALEVLRDAGFEVDSSIFPTRNHLYGIPDAPIDPYAALPGLAEIPPSVMRVLGRNVPFGGGFYLRAAPLGVTLALARRVLGAGRHLMVYVHPWELDAEQPADLPYDLAGRFIHYFNLRGTETKLAALLRGCGPFQPLPQTYAEAEPLLAGARAAAAAAGWPLAVPGV